jgi:hypothetical protein
LLLITACRAPADADRRDAAAANKAGTAAVVADAAVDDDALRTLLAYEYGEEVDLRAWWPADPDNVEPAHPGVPLQRRICADSGAGDPRWIAVCTRYGGDEAIGAPADVDLLRIRGRSEGGQPGLWVDRQSPGVDSGADGEPGAVEWLSIGPGRHVFAVHSRRHGLGRERAEQVTLYSPGEDRFEPVLTVGTARANPGACDPESGPPCTESAYAFTCSLRIDRDVDRAGYHPLTLQIRGHRGSRRIERDLALPRSADGYMLPRDSECDS